MANANLYALLQAGFAADRDSIAIETPARDYSWNDIERTSARYANLLASLGLPAGARVAVQVDKSPEALMLYLATLRAGFVYLPLNTAYRQAEIEYFLGDAEPSVDVCFHSDVLCVAELADSCCVSQVYTGV